MNMPPEDDVDLYKGASGWALAIEEFLTGVDAAVEKFSVDASRIRLIGHSNGGGMASYVVTQTDRFSCAVIIAPAMTNWVSSAFISAQTNDLLENMAGGVSLEQNPTEYIELSSAFRMNQVDTPILLFVGDEDGSFVTNTIELFIRLRAYNKDVTLVRYPGQGHVFNNTALDDFWERSLSFFKMHATPK